jgi:hypothetical protein
MHLIQAVRWAIGQGYLDFLLGGFDPSLTWLELGEAQRLKARGFVLASEMALKVNSEYLLPRQIADRPRVGFDVVELSRDSSRDLILSKQLTFKGPLSRIARTDYFRRLGLSCGRYICVHFDTRAARDALLQAFDEELNRWVGDWHTKMKNNRRIPILWSGEDHVPVEYWVPSADAGVRAKGNEIAIIPSEQPGIAMLLVSARHNPSTVRGVFHSHLKSSQFKEWYRRCVDYWKTVTVEVSEPVKNSSGAALVDANGIPLWRQAVRHVFDPKRHLRPKQKQHRSAKRTDLWLGLAGNDVVTDGVVLGKTSPEGRFLLEYRNNLTELLNRQRSAARRIKELEAPAATLPEALALYAEENFRLAQAGFF